MLRSSIIIVFGKESECVFKDFTTKNQTSISSAPPEAMMS